MSSESVQIKILKERYRSSMQEKATLVSAHLMSVIESGSRKMPEVLKTIHEDLHKLAGSSGMYGYDDVALLARQAMSAIDELQHKQLEHHLLELRNLLEQHTAV